MLEVILKMKNIFYYITDLGKIGIAEEENKIINVCFGSSKLIGNYIIKETPVIKEAYKQIQEYLGGCRKQFDLELNPKGTEFMKKVWNKLLEIPYGETRTYKKIAIAIENNKAYRAVGMANNKNPIPIFIPCHRVIGSNNKLIGFSGGLPLKQKLLELEKQYNK